MAYVFSKLYQENNPQANEWADKVEKAFRRDAELCREYNEEMSGGKWNGMMKMCIRDRLECDLSGIRKCMMIGLSLWLAGVLQAQNPIVQTCYTSDPAPMVHDGTLYVYTGHDEDHAD